MRVGRELDLALVALGMLICAVWVSVVPRESRGPVSFGAGAVGRNNEDALDAVEADSVPRKVVAHRRLIEEGAKQLLFVETQLLVVIPTMEPPGLMCQFLAARSDPAQTAQTERRRHALRQFFASDLVANAVALTVWSPQFSEAARSVPGAETELGSRNEMLSAVFCAALLLRDGELVQLCGLRDIEAPTLVEGWRTSLTQTSESRPHTDNSSEENSGEPAQLSSDFHITIKHLSDSKMRSPRLRQLLIVTVSADGAGEDDGDERNLAESATYEMFALNAENGKLLWKYNQKEFHQQGLEHIKHSEQKKRLEELLHTGAWNSENTNFTELIHELQVWDSRAAVDGADLHGVHASDYISSKHRAYHASMMKQLPFAWRGIIDVKLAHFSKNTLAAMSAIDGKDAAITVNPDSEQDAIVTPARERQRERTSNVVVVSQPWGVDVVDLHTGMPVTRSILAGFSDSRGAVVSAELYGGGVLVELGVALGIPCTFVVRACEFCSPLQSFPVACVEHHHFAEALEIEENDRVEEHLASRESNRIDALEVSTNFADNHSPLRVIPPILFQLESSLWGSRSAPQTLALVISSSGTMVCVHPTLGHVRWRQTRHELLAWDSSFENSPLVVFADLRKGGVAFASESDVASTGPALRRSSGLAIIRGSRNVLVIRLRDGELLSWFAAEPHAVLFSAPLIVDMNRDGQLDHMLFVDRRRSMLVGASLEHALTHKLQDLQRIQINCGVHFMPSGNVGLASLYALQSSAAVRLLVSRVFLAMASICAAGCFTLWAVDSLTNSDSQTAQLSRRKSYAESAVVASAADLPNFHAIGRLHHRSVRS